MPDFKAETVTRRTVLSYIASNFDPLGLISPAFLEAKLFLQRIIVGKKVGWDDSLPTETVDEWQAIVKKLSGRVIKLPRQLAPKFMLNDAQLELHGFADASKKAMGASV